MNAFEDHMAKGGSNALREAARFFMRDDPVYRTLRNVTARLGAIGVPYAVVGGMAVVAHGYDRTTQDVDILLTREGLETVHEKLEGLGYIKPHSTSRHLRDTDTKVKIEFLVSGEFPGDGKPKPVAFPDPADVATVIDEIAYLRLPVLFELKLASGMTSPSRLKDLADVQEMIKFLKLPQAFVEQLNPYVREKFSELWTSVQGISGDPE